METSEKQQLSPQAQQRNLVFRTNLQDIVSRFHICDVDPLTVDLGVVGVVTSWTQALHTQQIIFSLMAHIIKKSSDKLSRRLEAFGAVAMQLECKFSQCCPG